MSIPGRNSPGGISGGNGVPGADGLPGKSGGLSSGMENDLNQASAAGAGAGKNIRGPRLSGRLIGRIGAIIGASVVVGAVVIGSVVSSHRPIRSEAVNPPAETVVTNAVADDAATPISEVTAAPVTEAPVTPVPVTEAPVTPVPVTEAPVTEAPVTAEPENAMPVTRKAGQTEPEDNTQPALISSLRVNVPQALYDGPGYLTTDTDETKVTCIIDADGAELNGYSWVTQTGVILTREKWNVTCGEPICLILNIAARQGYAFAAEDALNIQLIGDYSEFTAERTNDEGITLRVTYLFDHRYSRTGTTDGTCAVKGSIDYTCALCGSVRHDETEYGSHSFEQTGADPGTCVKLSSTDYTCQVCGETRSEQGKYGPHNYKQSGITEGNCKVRACKNYTCLYCGAVRQESLDYGSHKWSAWVGEAGKHERYCSVCRTTETASCVAGRYEYGNGVVHEVFCGVCGREMRPEYHTFSSSSGNVCTKCHSEIIN